MTLKEARQHKSSFFNQKNKTAAVNPLFNIKSNLKIQQSAVIVDLCLRKTRAGKLHDYHDSSFSKCVPSTIFLPCELHLQKDAFFDCPYSSSVNQIALRCKFPKMTLVRRIHSPEKQ